MGSHVYDGNEAAARVAYALSEVVAIYPITPASPMGESSDDWAAAGRENLWGSVPRVIEMQSEAGAAGTLHGALMTGALATTFTASQGLLLMIPNMFKIAGELTPTVIHVAARTIATHALSIFGDHSDVMSVRSTGWAMLASASVQESQDLAAVAHVATLRTRVPFLHFFDGFRTSHELNRIDELSEDDLRRLVDDRDVHAHRARGLTPDAPKLRGTAQNPDVFFQAREAANPFYDAVPDAVQTAMDAFAQVSGRSYHLVDYVGHPEADRVLVLMGSGIGAVEETVEELNRRGERVGLIKVRLYRPFPVAAFLAALPATVRSLGVLDRTKEPGAVGEPLFTDVATVLTEAVLDGSLDVASLPRLSGGRYGLSSKEFTPQMVAGVFAALAADDPPKRFTVGIHDDVTHLSLLPAADFALPHQDGDVAAVFYGLGADGTVGANKNTVKIVGEHTDLHAQGYFVYDSKKSGAQTVSHLRFSRRPIRSTYLIDQADFVACHQFGFLLTREVLDRARPGATFLLNAPFGAAHVWNALPEPVQRTIIDKRLSLHVIDAQSLARELGLGGRINTIMQACFFRLSHTLPWDAARAALEHSVRTSYGRYGHEVVDRNLAAIDRAIGVLAEVPIPSEVTSTFGRRPAVPAEVPDFVERVTARILEGEGDLLPVSALPVDGTFPTGTTRYEKRAIAQEIPIWDPDICIDCGKCAIVCPHDAIKMKIFEPGTLEGAPGGYLAKDFKARELATPHLLTVQVSPDDCTGCNVCVEQCPAASKQVAGHKAINMEPYADHQDRERENFAFFEDIPRLERGLLPHDTVKGSQLLEPLFSYSSACAGCGETPYLKLVSQLFGDRLLIANATGCSSIYGGNLPTTPWGTNAEGRGPAWANSLFEDNAEFGLGLRLAVEQQTAIARRLLRDLGPRIGDDLVTALLDADQRDETGIEAQRGRVVELQHRLADANGDDCAAHLRTLAGSLVRKDVWIIGGDGWAYDIGYGGLDHVLASGVNVNVLVMDTEVYSNTGGQASKATPRAAVAKFASGGRAVPKKDLGALAMQYGTVYIAQIAMGANEVQTVRALQEAAAWDGPSLVLAYSTCIAHGFDMKHSMHQQRDAVKSGYWPLYRYRPDEDAHAKPFRIDSRKPAMPVAEFAGREGRFAMLMRSDPDRAAQLMRLAQADVDERWRYYEQLAGVERSIPHEPGAIVDEAGIAAEEVS
ncbi:pyruvate:ferredoxin (flavodoxin) oxidoreductase [Egicoccus sp. AB-alg6-2]|uniref:pyruvate:ferredoxin (flavodoxin) oxidoreductase n=1 Tax=Egicoccus sp. AB-alg6-2 TaxID=3242692 RepID=UPI00359D10EA